MSERPKRDPDAQPRYADQVAVPDDPNASARAIPATAATDELLAKVRGPLIRNGKVQAPSRRRLTDIMAGIAKAAETQPQEGT